MLFNSISFGIFLPIVFFLYWFLTSKNLKSQNLLLLVSSFYFYACWDFRFLFLLIFSIALDYYSGLKMRAEKTRKLKRTWLILSISINLSLLGVLKYYNFFVESFAETFSFLGSQNNLATINLILPVGISFYTFHGLSYIIDVYKDRIEPERDFVDYAVFVSFFPLLVAGPIERATHLLPQIQQKRIFSYSKAIDGLRQILWGFFKKVVVADNCAEYANTIFNNSEQYAGSTLLVGAFFFSIQIYCDFSGYSDIALGVARLFGIELLRNFAFPYFSRDIAEFWRRWHISLSSWFRDYVYFPMGGSRGGLSMKIKNTFVIFLLSGLWHGANWTFIVWGGLNALYFMPLLLSNRNRNNLEIVAKGRLLPSFREFFQILTTFMITVFAWIFFRAENVKHAFSYIRSMTSASILERPAFFPKDILGLICVLFVIEWFGREHKYAIEQLGFSWPKIVRWSFYYILIVALFVFAGKEQQFIYFQF
jgi:alginate O-acetyltransferase complex protein AlgI